MLKHTTLFLTLIAASVLAQPPGGELREHFVISTRNHTPLYYATAITSSTEALGTETYLIENTAGQRILIEVRENYRSRIVTADYAVNDAKPLRVTLHLPGKGATRSEWASELRAHPELNNEDVAATVEANGKALKTSEKEWKTGAAGPRGQVKSMLTPEFAAAMQAMHSVLGFPPFGGACTTYPFVADGAQCGVGRSLLFATVRPDCDFDARFGKPCDGAQSGRAKGQPKDRRVGPY